MSDFQEFLENSLQQKIKQLIPLTGGASADINRIILANDDELIVRRTLSQEKSVMAIPKILEAKIQKVVKKNGAPVPAIIFEFSEGEEIGEGYVMEAIPGETIPRKILRDKKFASAREKLPFEIGKSLAKIHQTQLDDLKALDQVTFSDSLGKLFQVYLSFNQPQPVFDLAFKWLEAQKLTEYGDVLVHGDFRFGNFIISEENLESIIDWELAHIGNPMEDLGWLCVRSWRFGNVEKRVGGLGDIKDLIAGYESNSDIKIDESQLDIWQLYGSLRWGVICMMQTFAHLSGMVNSVEKAAIGRRVSETEFDLMNMIKHKNFL
ncbi:MAG: phosphotransferase family protein [Pseudomonadota bacterium]|jgi:aminoglycoside phosphotransferase (APT) family kinase protein|nr:phosphotransferase family protein [Pseudomonadota bacterium]|tara:strand:- start:600 stop:1562 length:963 start_codon:yes stop_codon:yes gene_type:complete